MKLNLVNNCGYRWYSKSGIYVKGYFYYNNRFYNDSKMIDIFNNVNSVEEFIYVLNNLNGYYAIVIQRDGILLAAADRIGSFPIFFSTNSTNTFVSDDFRFAFPNNDISENNISFIEYLLLGYTTGNNTLYKNVNQLKAGEILFYDLHHKDTNLYRYYEYLHNETGDLSEDEFIAQLSVVHNEVFKRFINSLDGRKVIVPLSGGYDSRLIAEMLRKYEYENVICITWGNKDDWQVKIAQKVAQELGYQWIRVEHSRLDWYKWFRSDLFSKTNILTGFISSIPYLQENVSIEYLEKKYSIPKDSIFVSGNSGDFIEGQHIPADILTKHFFTPVEIAEIIFKKHFRLFSLKEPSVKEILIRRILDGIGEFSQVNQEQAASIFENWEWQERQSKFVSKSIKSFEVKGYEWRLPLWDNEIMEFWSKVPLKYRYERALFYKYADSYMGKNVPHANPKVSKYKIYKERLMDSRYGCFSGNRSYICGLLIKDRNISNDPILDLVKNKPIILHKINGLIALWNITNLRKEIKNIVTQARIQE